MEVIKAVEPMFWLYDYSLAESLSDMKQNYLVSTTEDDFEGSFEDFLDMAIQFDYKPIDAYYIVDDVEGDTAYFLTLEEAEEYINTYVEGVITKVICPSL